jgi:hypothetical protein
MIHHISYTSFSATNRNASGRDNNNNILSFTSLGQLGRRSAHQRQRFKVLDATNDNNEYKMGPTTKYLSKINADTNQQEGDIQSINGDVNGDFKSFIVNGSKDTGGSDLSILPAEDDDYSMSIPKPRAVDDPTTTLPSSQSEIQTGEVNLSEVELLKSKEIENATRTVLNQNASIESTDQQASMASWIRILWSKGDTNLDLDRDRDEESRRWSEWMTTGKKVRPSISGERKASDDAPSVTVKESSTFSDKVESSETANTPAEIIDKTKSPTKILATIGKELSRKKIESDQIQQQRKQEQREKLQIEKKQKQREETQYREQRDKDPGRISASDWGHNILNLFHSRILRDIRSPVIFSCIWATFWSLVYKSLISVGASSNSKISDLALRTATSMAIPTTAHSVMVSAMSLLLVFRTNSAYQRFAEGR